MSPKYLIEFAGGRPRTGRAMTAAERVRRVKKRREKWLQENAEAIAEYNQLIARHGTFCEGHRSF